MNALFKNKSILKHKLYVIFIFFSYFKQIIRIRTEIISWFDQMQRCSLLPKHDWLCSVKLKNHALRIVCDNSTWFVIKALLCQYIIWKLLFFVYLTAQKILVRDGIASWVLKSKFNFKYFLFLVSYKMVFLPMYILKNHKFWRKFNQLSNGIS